jgi:GTP-binding protein HflX
LGELKRDELSVRQERAMLVALLLPGAEQEHPHPLAELSALAMTAGARVVGHVIQRRERINPACYIGRGKAEQLAEQARANEADVIIFDNDLSPAQIRELERITDCKVVDRSELILDIFATRARTHQARLQVERAQLEYTAPRLRGMWTHLERIAGAGGGTQAGSVGGIGTRGPGERQIEIDRRLVQNRLTALGRELARIDRRKLREVRSRGECFTVSIVGYTNSGKSTLMNALTGARVKVEDKLFATLDTRTRQWTLGQGIISLLSDTVGFVRDLPHHLVASFQATLEETIHADLLLHVADVSNPAVQRQIIAVEQVLEELGCADKPTVLLLNKTDALSDPSMLQVLRASHPEAIPISARTGEGLHLLIEDVLSRVRSQRVSAEVLIDFDDGAALSALHRDAEVIEQHVADSRLRVKVAIAPANLDRLSETYSGMQIVRRG